MTLIRLQSRMLIPSLALVVPLLAACTTVTEERGGPQAPGIGFEEAPAVVDRTDRQHAPLTPMVQPPPPQAPLPQPPGPPATPAVAVPASLRIGPEHKYVNVRRGSSPRTKVVAVLKGGTQLELLGKEGSWLRVRWQHGGKTAEGWVYRKFVEGNGQ